MGTMRGMSWCGNPGGQGPCPHRVWGRQVVVGGAGGLLGRIGLGWLHLLMFLFDCVYVVIAVVACLALPALQWVFSGWSTGKWWLICVAPRFGHLRWIGLSYWVVVLLML